MYKTFIPYIQGGTKKVDDTVDQIVPDIMHFLKLVLGAGWQQRKAPMPNALLCIAAQKRAEDMAKKNYFSHTSPEGITPNEVVRGVGYVLPSWYPIKANNVESISIGANSAEQAIQGLLDSPRHHEHMVGEGGFYGSQNAAGAGKAKAQDGRWIWVFITAPTAG